MMMYKASILSALTLVLGCNEPFEFDYPNVDLTQYEWGSPCENGQSVYDEDVLHTVELTLSEPDIEALRSEAATAEESGEDPTWFEATLTVDGETLTGPVGVRLKGRGSLIAAVEAGDESYPMKIDTDRFTDGQHLDGLERINLHPDLEDMNNIREYLSYGSIRAFGVPTARTAFARVTLNGTDVGNYNLVEQMDGRFFRCHFDTPHGDLYKPEEESGTLADKGDAFSDYADAEHQWGDTTTHTAFLNLLDVLNNEPVSAWDATLDVEGALNYLAVNAAVGNEDYYASVAHNYYLYEAEPGRFTMLPWDMNNTQGPELSHPCGYGRNTAEFRVSYELLGDAPHVERYFDIVQRFIDGAGSIEANQTRLLLVWRLRGEEYREEWEETAVVAAEERGRAMLGVLGDPPNVCPTEAWP